MADRGARLHRHAGDALDPGFEPHDMRGLRERRSVAAASPTSASMQTFERASSQSARRRPPPPRRRVGHRRQRLVVDATSSAASLAALQLSATTSNRLADKARLVVRQHAVRARGTCRTASRLPSAMSGGPDDRPVRDRLEAVGHRVGAGQHREHAGQRLGGGVSMPRMRAWACGERTMTACAWPGSRRRR